MRVVQVASHPPTHLGGHEAYAFRISRALARMGVDVELLAVSTRNELSVLDGVRVRTISKVGEFYRLPLVNAIPYLTRTHAEIVHGHSYVFPVVVQAAFVSRLRSSRFLLHLHGAIQASKSYRTVPLALKERIYDPIIGRMLARVSDGIAAVAQTDLKAAERILRIPSSTPKFYLPNCVDVEETDELLSAPSFKSSGRYPSLFFAGRLVPEKGVLLLPELDRMLQRSFNMWVGWDIAGEGPLAADIMAWARRDASRIRFHGGIRGREYYESLAASDLLVLPSLGSEGIPTVCLEAMACKVPVVGFDTGGVSEVVLDRKTGFAVHLGDVNALCRRIVEILRDRTFRNRMGANARRLVETRFSVDNVAKNTLSAYSLLLSR